MLHDIQCIFMRVIHITSKHFIKMRADSHILTIDKWILWIDILMTGTGRNTGAQY